MCSPLEGSPISTSPARTCADRESFALDGADDKSGQIVIALRIDVPASRPFRRRSARSPLLRGAAHAFDKLLDHSRIELAHRHIVEEEERLGALRENVVDAVINDVGPTV